MTDDRLNQASEAGQGEKKERNTAGMIYILEDDDNIRKLVSYALVREGFEAEGFPTPKKFYKAMEKRQPDLILLDIMLPEEDGLSVLHRLRQDINTADLPVIMLTAKSSEYDKVTGLDNGADDYIAKPFGIVELTSRVRAVLRRSQRMPYVTDEKPEKAVSEEEYKVGTLYVDPSRHIIKVGGKEVVLSYKEFNLLMVLLEAKGKVVNREQLLSRVWGEYYGESRTLDVHIRKLRVKLGKKAGSYIQTVKGIGYKLAKE